MCCLRLLTRVLSGSGSGCRAFQTTASQKRTSATPCTNPSPPHYTCPHPAACCTHQTRTAATMKSFLAATAAAAIVAMARAEIDIQWSDCGDSGNHVKITDVTWSPKDAEPGDNITVTGTGVLDEVLTASEITLTLSSIIKHTFDGCKGAKIEAPLDIATIIFPPAGCPVKAGNTTSTRYIAIGKDLPKGHTSSKLEGKDQNGEPTYCVAMTLIHK